MTIKPGSDVLTVDHRCIVVEGLPVMHRKVVCTNVGVL